MVIGNSSSGILEVPYFKIPTVNIGKRQNGRVKSHSIIDCNTQSKNITKAIKKAMSPKYQNICKDRKNNIDGKGGSIRAYEIIKRKINKLSSKKKFYDINFSI